MLLLLVRWIPVGCSGATDVNSDTVVIDRTSKDDGRVVVLGTEGNVKWIYQGHPQINTEYKPFDINLSPNFSY
jgi:hypothetical protein